MFTLHVQHDYLILSYFEQVDNDKLLYLAKNLLNGISRHNRFRIRISCNHLRT